MKASELTYMERKLYAPLWIKILKTTAQVMAIWSVLLFIFLFEDIIEYVFHVAFGWYA